MKTMNLTQKLNPEYMGQLNTPEIDTNVYQVTKVMNSIQPEIGDCLTKDEVDKYCHQEDWKVIIS